MKKFSTQVLGYDKNDVENKISAIEDGMELDIKSMEQLKEKIEKDVEQKNVKIEKLKLKLEYVTQLYQYMDGSVDIIEQIKEKMFNEKQKNMESAIEFYDLETEKLENEIKKIDEEIEKEKIEFVNVVNLVHSSVNKAFNLGMQESLATLEDNKNILGLGFNSDNLTGKILAKDLKDRRGNIIAFKGEKVDFNIVEKARNKEIMLELFMSV